MPNGVASSVPSSFVPTIDQSDDRDGEHERDQEAVAHVARHRVHRHAGVAAVPVAVRVVGALRPPRGRAGRASPARPAGRRRGRAPTGRRSGSRSPRPSGAAARSRSAAGSKVTVAVCATGLASTASTPGDVRAPARRPPSRTRSAGRRRAGRPSDGPTTGSWSCLYHSTPRGYWSMSVRDGTLSERLA